MVSVVDVWTISRVLYTCKDDVELNVDGTSYQVFVVYLLLFSAFYLRINMESDVQKDFRCVSVRCPSMGVLDGLVHEESKLEQY